VLVLVANAPQATVGVHLTVLVAAVVGPAVTAVDAIIAVPVPGALGGDA
jgi:hypothetical protein